MECRKPNSCKLLSWTTGSLDSIFGGGDASYIVHITALCSSLSVSELYSNPFTMDFSQALIEAKNGKKIARKQFRDTCYVFVQFPDEGSANTEPYFVMQKGEKRFPVDLSCESIFADDWYVVT